MNSQPLSRTSHTHRLLRHLPPTGAVVPTCWGGAAGAPHTAPRGGGPRAPAPPPAAPAQAPAAGDAGRSSANKEMENAGQLAAAGWLLLLDRKDWGTAWDTSAAMFRATVPLPAWMDGIPKVREPLGAMVERSPADAVYRNQLQGKPAGDYVTAVFNTRFQNKPDAQEVVTTVREPDGKWRVTGYAAR